MDCKLYSSLLLFSEGKKRPDIAKFRSFHAFTCVWIWMEMESSASASVLLCDVDVNIDIENDSIECRD